MSSSMPAVARHTQSPLAIFSTTLLLHVFFYFVDAVHIPFRPTDPRNVLSLVCKRWANIIQSSPCLWDAFRFTAPPTSMTCSENDILRQFARLYMERCGQNSLNINMVFSSWTFSFVDSLIIPYMHRIRSLRYLISGDIETMEFLTMEGQFSALESIEIIFCNDATALTSLPHDNPPCHTSALRAAPRLRKATMHLINGLNPLSLPLPWEQLTTLNLGTVSMLPDACITILDSTSERLSDAFLYIEFIELSKPHHILWKRKVTMHALTTLRLRFLFPSADTRLFSLLRFPSLQNLWVQMHDVFQDWSLSLYTKLLQASTNPLRQLFLCDFYSPGFGMMPEQSHTDNAFVAQYRRGATTYHPLERLLKVVRNVEELHLPVGLPVDEHTVEAIASCALLPRLHSLDLGINDGWKIIFMARRRRAQAVNIPLPLRGSSHPSQTIPFRRRHIYVHPPPPTGIHFIHMLVPRDGYTEDQRRTLIEAAQALAFLGITFCVQTTQMLPLL